MANQGITKLASKHDPDGQRTVVIITKADVINELRLLQETKI